MNDERVPSIYQDLLLLLLFLSGWNAIIFKLSG
jgi:hypothetical protein